MKNILKKLTIPALTVGMTLMSGGTAFGLSFVESPFADGNTWGNPFDGLINKTKDEQRFEIVNSNGFIFATAADILTAADTDSSGSLTEAELISFMSDLGFGDKSIARFEGTFENTDTIGFDTNFTIGPPTFGALSANPLGLEEFKCPQDNLCEGFEVGALFYKAGFTQQAPTTGTLGLLGLSLFGIGLAAYRKK